VIPGDSAPKGFSISELLLALTLITIAIGASFPLAFSYLRQHRTREAAHAVASQLRTARIEAVRRNAPNGISLTFGYPDPQDLFLVVKDKPGVRDRLKLESPTPDRPKRLPASGIIFSLPAGLQFAPVGGPFNSLVFRADGTVEAAQVPEAMEGLIAVESMNFVVQVSYVSSGNSQTILIGRTGAIAIR
jgi:hypothetical protein